MEVTIRRLTLQYGDVVAVRDLDLDVAAGESIVLLGQSGCGKTSTMRCVAGLEDPTDGVIRIGDTTVFDAAARRSVPAHRRNVGMVFQSYAVWPHRTVEENVVFPLRMAKVPREQARRTAREVLDVVGLGHLAERGASNLSGGQMQRVALARSMAMRPSVLLLDEPLSNLDARLRDDLRVELRRIQQEQNLTSIYVTHDQTEALALADRVAIMQGGRITQLSAPTELYSHPASVSIAAFLGVTNVFELAAGGDGTAVLAGHDLVLRTAHTGPVEGHAVCIRPESVQVVAGDAAVAGVNVLPGTVRARSYQGSLTRLSVALDGGLLLDAVCPSDAASGTEVGKPVHVRVAAEHVQVLPHEVPGTPQAETVGAAQEVAA